jgi:malonyl CoA-acyl carrier protein transacylase
MGAGLFERYPDSVAEADAVLGFSIRELCLDDPRGVLGSTRFTQPALFVVNALSWRARQEDGGAVPAFVAGHSLGEFNALLAASVFDFETGLRMVRRRGELMGRVSGGGMAAVIGLSPDRIAEVLREFDGGSRLDVANVNALDQTVIAGPVGDLETAGPVFAAAGARAYKRLQVSAPFHSRYMRAAMDEFSTFLDGFRFETPTIPVVSNVTAAVYPADQIRAILGRQIGHAVRWLDSMAWLLDQGVTEFEEVGPGNVLSKLALRIRKARG